MEAMKSNTVKDLGLLEERLLSTKRGFFGLTNPPFELVVETREEKRNRNPQDDFQTQRDRQGRTGAAMFVAGHHGCVPMAEQSGDVLLRQAHPPPIQHEVIVFWFA
jgi:hypothetical protein